MGGPEMAPHTPPPPPRSSQGLDRAGRGPEMAPHTPPPAPRSSQGLDRAGRGPEMAPHTPPSAPRSSRGLDRAGGSAVPVVTEPRVHVHDVELAGLERGVLVLTAEERRWRRRRVTTRAGRALAR